MPPGSSNMKVALITEHKTDLQLTEITVPQPGPGQALVKIHASGVCHTDIHAVDGDWAVPTILPLVPGHEGAGVVAAVGPGVESVKVGDRVGIPWLYSACGFCEFCVGGRETLCTGQQNAGYSVNGCFAEYTLAAADYLAKLPEGLTFEQAAPVLCAGVTTYAALKATAVKPGQWVTIIGAAGGLGHLAVQYAANCMGMRVVAIDVGQDKLDFAKRLGAEVGVEALDKTLVDQVKEATHGGSHGVLCLAASLGALKSAIQVVRRGGTVVLVGLPKGELGVDVVDMVLRGVTLRGSIVGTREDMREALDFAARGKVHAEVETHEMSDINAVFKELRTGQLKGRAVLKLQ